MRICLDMLDETDLLSNLLMTRTSPPLFSSPSSPLFSFVYLPVSYANSTDLSEANTNFLNADGWLYELAYNHWPTDVDIKTIVQRDTRSNYILQGVGPYELFWDADLCMSLPPPPIFIYLYIYI